MAIDAGSELDADGGIEELTASECTLSSESVDSHLVADSDIGTSLGTSQTRRNSIVECRAIATRLPDLRMQCRRPVFFSWAATVAIGGVIDASASSLVRSPLPPSPLVL